MARGWGSGSGGNAGDGEREMKLLSLAAHLLLCGPVPTRPLTDIGPQPGGWGPLLYTLNLHSVIYLIKAGGSEAVKNCLDF